MLENYLLLEPNVSCEHIIKAHLLENLLQSCHNPKIHELLVNLLAPFLSKFTIFGECQVKLWEWCYENNFFYKVISLIQNDKIAKFLEEESGTTEEILQNSKKYYSGEKTQLIMKEMVKKFGMFQNLIENKGENSGKPMNLPGNSIENAGKETLDQALGPISVKDFEVEYVKIEEIQGNLPDIDDFKGFLLRKSANIIEKTSKNQQNIKNSQEIVQKPTKKLNNSQHLSSDEGSLNKSTLDLQMGFTISKVKGIYPNRLCKEMITALDKVSMKSEYKWQNVVEDEKIAFPAASLVLLIVSDVVENEKMQSFRDFLGKRKCVGGEAVVDMLFNNSSVCVEKIFLVG